MTAVEEWWKKEWPNLKEQPDCSASSDSCWICDELVKWNVALTNFAIRLSESSLGKICLTIDVTLPATNLQQLEDTAAITVWLLKKHRCIETLQIGRLNNQDQVSMQQCQSGSFGNVTVPEPVAELKSSLRHISIGGHAPDNWASLLDAIGPIENLESLTLLHIHASPTSVKTLAELLAANRESVRKVYVEGFMCSDYGGGGIAALMDATARYRNIEEDEHISDVLMEGIAKCRKLTELIYPGELGAKGIRSLDDFLRSNRTLRIFWLPPKEKAQIAFCSFISENKTLTELELPCEGSDEGSINDVLRALLNHTTLKRLTIHGGLQNSNPLQLNVLLSENRSLHSLTIRDAIIYFAFGKLIAEGLSENKTLECLDISECYVDFQSVLSLCDALTTNMCSVKFGCLEPPPINRPANENDSFYLNRYWATLEKTRQTLATKLREKNLYGRVQLEWSDYDASGLAASLRFRAIDLELDIAKLDKKNCALVCKALSSSLLVRSLTLRLAIDGGQESVVPGGVLCQL
ncbi:uncharacterized protein LOC144142671 [Haemaphysalis longicornis]